MPDPAQRPLENQSPPRAFTQGVGLVFQVAGGTLFLAMMFVCCASGLLSKDWATKTELTKIGWHARGDAADVPTYSAQKAMTISLFSAIFFGIALAAIGLGLQAQHRAAPWLALAVTGLATVFWTVQFFFAASMRSITFASMTGVLAVGFFILLMMAFNALSEMRRNPPPKGHEILPKDYKIPYSHYHEDPPEVRLERELEQRRERLAVQQKELEMLEERLRKKIEQQDSRGDPPAQ